MKTLFNIARPLWMTLIVILALAVPAFAGGTAPAIDIENTATLDYSVGTTTQTQLTSNTVSFKVDRLVDYSVSNGGNLSVTPNSSGQLLSFTVQNDGNETYDFDVSIAQTGDFVVANLQLFDDANTNGVYDAGEEVTTIDNLGVDVAKVLYVAGDIPSTAINGEATTITLTVDDVLNSAGAALADDTGNANTDAGVETAWAKLPPTATSADYIVGAADLSISKGYVIVSDPTGGANPKAIPGAVIEYTLTIANGAGASTAVGVSLTDDAPANTTYVANSTTQDAVAIGTPDGGTCPLAAGYNIGDVNAGSSIVVKFRVTID